ncbi:hypothetical protein MLD38_028489 [Melastoma candidum]|uniref:Uncharacterized protein n=1 Tax=Melastoma candidum TaxID=119954 RepID=A0ACB9N1R4_9MYRT|nr:hypothetical protein MLD38_028489 [Melastoma candidum]
MKRISTSDSLGALNSMCPPPSDDHSPRNRDMYNGEFQSMLDGFDDDVCGDEAGQGSSKKRRLSIVQVKALEKNFEVENKLEPERKVKLAQELGLQPRQVAVWFQNRRARWKTKQLERDFSVLKASFDTLKVNYDTLKQDNDALLKEVEELKSKLNEENSIASDLSVKEEEVFMPYAGNNYMGELGVGPTQLVSRTSAEMKDGSFDSESSAILYEENSNSSPNPAVSSSKVVQPSQQEKNAAWPSAALEPPKFRGFQFQKVFQPPTPQHQYVKLEEREFFSGDEACDFFSDEQAPSLHWYSPDEWN